MITADQAREATYQRLDEYTMHTILEEIEDKIRIAITKERFEITYFVDVQNRRNVDVNDIVSYLQHIGYAVIQEEMQDQHLTISWQRRKQ